MGKQNQSGEKANSELLKVIAEQNHEKILEYDVATDEVAIYTVVNGQYVTLYTLSEYVEKKQFGEVFIEPADKKGYQKAIRSCLKKPTHTIIDARFIEKGKKPEWHRFYLVSVGDEDNKVVRIVGRLISVQKEKELSEKIRRKAEIDVLTNVYNHKAFEDLCEKAIVSCKSDAIFIMLDVDDFKMINDTQGHAVGDLVLEQTGAVLNAAVGNHGIAGRLGGDEFAAFVWDFSNRKQMEQFCQELWKNLKTIIFDMEYSASMGVSVLENRKLHFQDLYYEADQAVYEAKRRGKNQFVFFGAIETNQQKKEDVPVKESGTANEKVLLEELKLCLDQLAGERDQEGTRRVLFSLLEFFDADCMVIVCGQDGELRSVEECHKESAQTITEVVLQEIKSGNANNFFNFVDKRGEVRIANVKSIKEDHQQLYLKLAGDRIWSVVATELIEGNRKVGILCALNPRRHFEESGILSMVGDYLSVRYLHEELRKEQEYDRAHDKVTGLWNRETLIRWLMDHEDNEFTSFGIVTTDVIHLAEINKQFGYLNGNKKLARVAKILSSVLESFAGYRYDEDEMLVLCPNVDKMDMELMVNCLREKLAEFEVPVAMGYSWSAHPHVRNQITEAEVVMNNDKLKLMQGSMLDTRIEQSVIDEVQDLIKRGHYLVYLQPKVNIHTGRTEGAEALIRQLDDELGIVGPGVFIPVLERYNLVHMIDLFVLEEIFRYQKEQIAVGHRTIPISVNFSKMTIMYPELVERVRALAQKYEVPEGLIHIEVTETVGDMDHVVIEKVADSLKAMGFKLSMDDFGSHYSNLSVLIQYDFDSAKIDRSMVMEITKNQKSRIVLDYMTSLINDLGIHCIVEGIETKEQVDILKKTKAEMIQGFYFGKPVPKEEFYDSFMVEDTATEAVKE